MTPRRTILTCVAIVVVMLLAFSVVLRRGAADQPSGARTSAAPPTLGALDCGALLDNGIELEGSVSGRRSQAYFDRWPGGLKASGYRSASSKTGDVKASGYQPASPGRPEQVSGIVVFPGEPRHGALADTPIGLQGPLSDDGCGVELKEAEGGSDASVWRLRIESLVLIKGTRRMADGHTEDVVFNIVPETPCNAAGEWRTFHAPQWPITFDYPANWVLTDDQDDVNIECPSVTALATGGSWLTFERGQSPPAGTDEPYWFVRLANDDWRVAASGCADRASAPDSKARCAPARRSERNGMTVLQGAAGEHRLYRAGVGYLGQGGGITRYLFVLRDQWVSLDSAGVNEHYDDIGEHGGPVLLDGDAVGERVVRSIKPR